MSQVEPEQRDMRERLVDCYRTALEQQRAGGRVEIHVGTETMRIFREFATVDAPELAACSTAWGFPVVEQPRAATLHLSVHTVHTIY